MTPLTLTGLQAAPSQVWGGIRLVPLLRAQGLEDLRLSGRVYLDDCGIVSVDKNRSYLSYIPQGLVLNWSDDGSPLAPLGGWIGKEEESKNVKLGRCTVGRFKKMVHKEERNQLRFLPLHLAMEGFLSLFFSGPTIEWPEYSWQVLRHGLSPRTERSIAGQRLLGLEEALKVFEIHPDQCGVLVFISGALASAFVVPHPADYHRLHESLIRDFYGETLGWYSDIPYDQPWFMPIDEQKIQTIADLSKALARMRQDWEAFQMDMAAELWTPVQAQTCFRAGPFTLERFHTGFADDKVHHIGERILRSDGTLAYLKTYRLEPDQRARAWYLTQLAAHQWNLEATATALGIDRLELIKSLEHRGLGKLLKQNVREGR